MYIVPKNQDGRKYLEYTLKVFPDETCYSHTDQDSFESAEDDFNDELKRLATDNDGFVLGWTLENDVEKYN